MRRTDLFPSAVVPVGKMYPSMAGQGSFVFKEGSVFKSWLCPHPHPVGEKRVARAGPQSWHLAEDQLARSAADAGYGGAASAKHLVSHATAAVGGLRASTQGFP